MLKPFRSKCSRVLIFPNASLEMVKLGQYLINRYFSPIRFPKEPGSICRLEASLKSITRRSVRFPSESGSEIISVQFLNTKYFKDCTSHSSSGKVLKSAWLMSIFSKCFSCIMDLGKRQRGAQILSCRNWQGTCSVHISTIRKTSMIR